MDSTDFEARAASFEQHLRSSTRILALLGAGLSAASNLPTFRGAQGYVSAATSRAACFHPNERQLALPFQHIQRNHLDASSESEKLRQRARRVLIAGVTSGESMMLGSSLRRRPLTGAQVSFGNFTLTAATVH